MDKLDFDITPDQILLLKAAVFPPQEAVGYWQQWKEHHQLADSPAGNKKLPTVLDALDRGSYRLLPLVYRNLETTGDAHVKGLQPLYRRSWMRNQRHLRLMRESVRVLRQAGIETMLIKGLAQSLLYYKDLGARYMTDADVLVPSQKIEQALRCLLDSELNLRVGVFEQYMQPYVHASHLLAGDGHDFDLHKHLLTRNRRHDADAPYWRDARPLAAEFNLPCRVLSPTHQLFHNLVHGNAPHPESPLRWVADCYVIYSQHKIDWDEILARAVAARYVWPVRHGLRVLVRDFKLVLPEDFTRKLDSLSMDETEVAYRRFLFRAINEPQHLPRKVYNFYWVGRYEHALFFQDYARQPFGRWFTGKLLSNARAFLAKRVRHLITTGR